jgi:hypothetical protein
MRNIGLLLTKDEAPILADTLKKNTRFIKEIYVLDGGNDDTAAVVKRFPEVTAYFHERDLLPPDFKAVDSIRQVIFKIILANTQPGDWVTLMHGDEMFFHDPQLSISVAEKLDCNLVRWFAAHFFPHCKDLKNWDVLKNLPVYERFTYYAHYKSSCWIEDRQFKITEGMYYEEGQHSGVLPLSPVHYKPLPVYPVYHHFKVWNLDLNSYTFEHSSKYHKKVARPNGKWGVVHYAPKKFEQFFISKYPKYPCTSRFDGSFGKLSREFDSLVADVLG